MGKQVTNEQYLGGRTTNSPPSNVDSHLFAYQILTSGIDKLVLAIDVKWLSDAFFIDLRKAKSDAIDKDLDILFELKSFTGETSSWRCLIKPHGSSGYEWLLIGKDFSWRIGNWMEPSTRPSIMVEIHSENLWRVGFEHAIQTIKDLILCYGGRLVSIKPSRVDICLDMLMPSDQWQPEILQYIVSRAHLADTHKNLQTNEITGFSIGRGSISARIYDKALEIAQKSKKVWMYDIWEIDKNPEGYFIVRVEFQLRRETLKELGLNFMDDLPTRIENLWAYCSEKWLQFKNNQGKHHTQRNTLSWWKSVQTGFNPNQKANPLIRCKAFQEEEAQLFAQAYGMISSIKALHSEKNFEDDNSSEGLFGALIDIFDMAKIYGKNDFEFNEDIKRKRAKYQRIKGKNT